MPTDKPLVLRNRTLLKRLPVLIGVLVVLGFLQGDDRTGALIFWIGAAILVALALRPSLTIAEEGLIVCNLLPKRYLWADVRDVENHIRLYGPGLRLHLDDGSKKNVWAVMSGKGAIGRGWIEQTIEQVRRRWQDEARRR